MFGSGAAKVRVPAWLRHGVPIPGEKLRPRRRDITVAEVVMVTDTDTDRDADLDLTSASAE